MIRLLTILALLLLAGKAPAQADMGLASMSGIWQAGYANPAILHNHRLIVALPGLRYSISSKSFAWGDLFREGSNGMRQLDPDQLISRLKDRNLIRQQAEIPLLGLGFRGKEWMISGGLQLRSTARLEFPRELAQLLWEGNAPFIGKTVDLGTSFNASAFYETFVGFALHTGQGLSVGGRIKFLSGAFNASAVNERLMLSVGEDAYELLLDADYRMNTSLGLTWSGLDSIAINRFELGPPRLFGAHPGIALDLGLYFRSGPLALQASIADLGRINWKAESGNLSLNGTYAFRGLDVFQQLLDGDSGQRIGLLDSLNALLEVRHIRATYHTYLPVRLLLGAAYDLSKSLQATGTALAEWEEGRLYTALALGGRLRTGKWLELGFLYAVRYGTTNHLGLNAILNTGPVQLFAATDHLGAFLQPGEARHANFRLGINLRFGEMEQTAQ